MYIARWWMEMYDMKAPMLYVSRRVSERKTKIAWVMIQVSVAGTLLPLLTAFVVSSYRYLLPHISAYPDP